MIQIHFSVFLAASLWLLILPLDWFLAVIFAALFHESCHIFMLYLLNGSVKNVEVYVKGCVIETDTMEPWKQCLCIFAGPFGSFLLMVFCKTIPKLAVCGLIHGFFNLMPVMPLDGGRLLSLMLYRLCPEKEEIVMFLTKAVVYILAVIIILLSLGKSM